MFLIAMSYRRNNEKELAWREWLRKNQNALNQCGLPEIVLMSEAHWWDFLMHGYLDHHDDPSNFKVDALSKEELKCLKKFLESELTPKEMESSLVLLQLEAKLSNAFSES